MHMNNDKKTFANKRATAFSCLAIVVAIGANILLFCILAVARTTPSPAYPQEYEPMQIIALDLPEPTSAEPTGRETITDVVQLGPEPTDTEPPRLASDMASPAFPRLAERINDAVFQLPGLPINQANVSLLQPERTAPVGSVEKPASASKVDRLPSKTGGPPPRYPQWARRGDLEAVVTLRFIVTAEGTVEDVKIHEIDGDERFGAEAIQAISQWRFSPAIRAGKPIPCWCFQKVSFKFTR
jgi:protein TonB